MTMTPQEALKEAIEFFGKWDDAKGQALAEALRKLQNDLSAPTTGENDEKT